jgi:hypothetical protein
MTARLALALVLIVIGTPGRVAMLAQPAPNSDGVRVLLQRLEQVVQAGDARQYLDLLVESADIAAAETFAREELRPGATRVAIRERDREALIGTLPGDGYRLSVEVFVEFGARARTATWRLDVKRLRGGDAEGTWRVAGQEQVTQVENLYRLSLNPGKQFNVRDLKIAVEDLDLTLQEGAVFVVDTDQGSTGLMLSGRGEANFHPAPDIEKGQLKIFAGAATFQTRFDTTYIRMNPQDLDAFLTGERLMPRPVDQREFKRADDVFRELVTKSYAFDMAVLSRELWSTLPPVGDFLAEIHTARYDTLTYARSGGEPEDISFFDRKRRRNISLYSSAAARERVGRSYNEDDLVSYDVLGYDLEVNATPERSWLEGRARLQIRVLATAINSITLRLAEGLVVQSIVSDQFGRLQGMRVRNQNSIIVSLPATLLRDDDLMLTVVYAGRIEPQNEDNEALAVQGGGGRPPGGPPPDDTPIFQAERNYVYSNRSYWYPQATVTDYATASIRITIPANLDCVASGVLDAGFPMPIPAAKDAAARKVYLFTTTEPLRYLSFVISRFTAASPVALPVGADGTLVLSVHANPRQVRRGRELAERATEIIQFYAGLVGEAPYPSFTLALVESDLPGGHSPGYFAIVNQPLPTTPYVWRNDPASFEDFPEFFLAHEIAHQWWGQAVSGRNYHEQWLSEGFAQYFAALYAQQQRGDSTFTGVLKQFRRWGMQQSDQGPISLGYRLGHIRGDSRVFRAVVYNKSAAVLHMLRRLVGDPAFFKGVRRFYTASRFKKAGTDDFRMAMEEETGRSLEQFFEQWIYGAALPRLKVGHRVEAGPAGPQAVIHIEQLGEVFVLPVTVTITYADGKDVNVIVPVSERVVDFAVPVTGTVRAVDVNRDDGTLAEFVK